MEAKWDWGNTDLEAYLRYDNWKPEVACRILSFHPCSRQSHSFLTSKEAAALKQIDARTNELYGLWLSRGNAAKYEKHPPAIFIEWALTKNSRPDWLDWAIERGLYAPKQETEKPLRAVPTAAKVEATRRGITKGAVINAFEGLHFNRGQWDKYLASTPEWLKECRVAKGNKSTSATWNPVLIAAALYDKKIQLKKLDAVFVGLKDWADEWREASASFRN